MELQDPIERKTRPPISRWTSLLGTMIAMFTLTVPMIAISSCSYSNQPETSAKTIMLGDNSDGMILRKP
jgi:hypothetical protein